MAELVYLHLQLPDHTIIILLKPVLPVILRLIFSILNITALLLLLMLVALNLITSPRLHKIKLVSTAISALLLHPFQATVDEGFLVYSRGRDGRVVSLRSGGHHKSAFVR